MTGNDVGGMSSSLHPVSSSTWYHFFIFNAGGIVESGFDTPVTGTNLAANHSATNLRRIGSVLTDGSSNIIPFIQLNDRFIWDVPVEDENGTAHTTAVSIALSTPEDLEVIAELLLHAADSSPTTQTNILVTALDIANTLPTATLAHIRVGANYIVDSVRLQVKTNLNKQVRLRSSAIDSGVGVDIMTMGWIDPRGRSA